MRRVLFKWWPKEEFFGEGKTHDKKGIISLKPSANIMRNMNADTPSHESLFKDLLLKMDKESVKAMFKDVFGDSKSRTEEAMSSSAIVPANQPALDTEMEDKSEDEDFSEESFQEAQDPNEDQVPITNSF